MRCLGAAIVAGVCVIGGVACPGPASAEIVVSINKSTQRMTVVVDGQEQHVWKVSTGTGGGPRKGTYRPERLERKWFSHKYGMSPMPHSIFFHEGYAIHGTIYVSRLGNRASHGCVRLHPDNAAILFKLVQSQGMAATTIVVSDSDYVASRPAPKRVNATVESAPKAIPAHLKTDAAPDSTGAVPVTPAPSENHEE